MASVDVKSEDKTEKMINTVDGLESSNTNLANEKTAKVDDQVQTENVKQEIGSPSKINKGHCDTPNTNAQEPKTNKDEISGQTMAGLTMPGQAMPDQTMPAQTMADQTIPSSCQIHVPVLNHTMPGQAMSGVTLPSQTMAGMTMAGQTTLGYNDTAGVNSLWQQGMFMPPGMMPVPQMPPPPPGMFPPMNPWMQYYGMPYMMPPYYSNCPPGFGMNNQWQLGSNQWQPGNNQWQPDSNQWQPGNNQWQPGSNQWQPGNNQMQPGNNQWQPSNNLWQPGNNQGQPSNNNGQPGNDQCNQYYGYQQQQPWNQGNQQGIQQQESNHGEQQGGHIKQQDKPQGDRQQQQSNPDNQQRDHQQQQGPPIPPPRRRNNLKTTDNLPKGLRYDGTENWFGFKTKFTRYMEVKNWTHAESRDYLCWTLEGKASEYYATLITRNENIGFLDVLSKLEKRFGGVPLPDTAQMQLANSRQKPEESIEDWADRVVQLSVYAFQDLPEEYMYRQAINRICHGCLDKEAGQYAVNMNLDSVELAVDKIKNYQFNHQVIYGHDNQEVREGHVPTNSPVRSDSDDTERRPRVKTKLIRSSGTQKGQGNQDGIQLIELTRQMANIKDDMKELLRYLENLQSGREKGLGQQA